MFLHHLASPIRRGLTVGLTLFSFLLIGPAVNAAPPNVILILADDLGAADLGCYGSTFHRTPNLDQFAKSGTKFTHAYAACPVCSPTRAALMTGLYPQRFGITDWLPGQIDRPTHRLARPTLPSELPLDSTTIAEAFRTAGYTTGHIGKWHLGGDGFSPLEHGFDVNIAGDHTGTPLSYFAPFRNKNRTMPGLETAPAGEYLTDRLTAEAEKFLDANAQKPFFLYMPHYAVHTPLKAPADLVAKYPNKPTGGKQSNATYAAMLESLDSGVGRILAKLDSLKLRENTIVIFTSDNGGLATEGTNPATYNGAHREGKGFLYEGGVRIPCLMRGPKCGSAGQVLDTPMISMDWFPTLCELCGIKVPAKTDGVSLAPLLTMGAKLPERNLYWHYPHYANQGSRPGASVRSGNFKFIENFDLPSRELYDIIADPRESQNLIAKNPTMAAKLTYDLHAWQKAVGAKMPTPNPKYLPHPQAENGEIVLPARGADVHGVMLRYEPLPHKNTLGFWVNADDYATWELTVSKPGTFTIEVLQGCGTGQGGSEATVVVAGQTVPFTVKDTGGFQAFEACSIGKVTIKNTGRITLELRAKTKAKNAIMDVRRIVLKPVS